MLYSTESDGDSFPMQTLLKLFVTLCKDIVQYHIETLNRLHSQRIVRKLISFFCHRANAGQAERLFLFVAG